MTMLLFVTLAAAGKYGVVKQPTTPPSVTSTSSAAPGDCQRTLEMSADGLAVCGTTATFSYPAEAITDLLGPWDRTWKPESEGGVPVQKYVYDTLGLTVREPSDGAGGSQVVMLELTCDEQNRHGPFADKPFAGVVQVGELRVACGQMESDFLEALAASGLGYSETDWKSYRIPLGDNEVAVGFPLEFQRPSPEDDAPVSYIELRPKKD